MAIENVKQYLKEKGFGERVIEFTQSSATVQEAADALGCEPSRIAKTMAFQVGEQPTLVVVAGDGKVNNSMFKAAFGCKKAVMIRPEELPEKIGHAMGGVCPFAVKEGVPVYLDESLRRFDIVYPAAGNAASCVKLTVPELEQTAQNVQGWVDIAKGWREE